MQDSTLVMAPYVPVYDHSASALRLYRIIQRLAQKGNVVFLGQEGEGLNRYHTALEQNNITVYTIDKDHRLHTSGAEDLMPVTDLSRLLKEHRFSSVLMEGYETAAQYLDVISQYSPDSLRIIDVTAPTFKRMAQERAHTTDSDQAWAIENQRRKEIALYNQADALLTATTDDRRLLGESLDHPDIRLIPHLHPLMTEQQTTDPNDPQFYENWYGAEAIDHQTDTLSSAPPVKRKDITSISRITSPYREDEQAGKYRHYHDFTTFQPALTIAIPVFNGLRYTQECVKAIRNNTAIPFDIVLIDNGSTDGTAEWAAKECIPTIRNEENKGFGYACNQGMMVGVSPYVVLLNNDVIVPEGWADRLMNHLKDDKKIGLIGPCTNYAGSRQQIEARYADKEAFKVFSEELYQKQQGKRDTVDHLVGLCLMMRRNVLMEVGLFDVRFGLGNYEDNDYNVRTRMAGYSLAIARDVFVHHYGSRTFIENKIDYERAMKDNKKLFESKWGSVTHPKPALEIYTPDKDMPDQTGPSAETLNIASPVELADALSSTDETVQLPQADPVEADATESLDLLISSEPSFDDLQAEMDTVVSEGDDATATEPDSTIEVSIGSEAIPEVEIIDKADESDEIDLALNPVEADATEAEPVEDAVADESQPVSSEHAETINEPVDSDSIDKGVTASVADSDEVVEPVVEADDSSISETTITADNEVSTDSEDQSVDPGKLEEITHLMAAGTELQENGEFDEAIAQYRKAVEISPETADLRMAYGIGLFSAGRTDEALSQFRKAAELDTTSADPYNSMGCLAFQQGDLDEAVHYFTSAIERDETHLMARKNLADVYVQQEAYWEAINELENVLKTDAEDVESFLAIGNTYYKLGGYESAAMAYQQALNIAPDNTDALANLEAVQQLVDQSGHISMEMDYAEEA